MTITKITTHSVDALNRLLYEFKDLPKIASLNTMNSAQIQELENAAFDFLTKIPLDTATGIILDRWGIVLDELRNGLSDDEYRVILKLKISKNLCTGTAEDLIKFFNFMLGISTVQLSELFPGVIYFTAVNVVLVGDPTTVKAQLQQLCPAGVNIGWISIGTNEHPFAFATHPNPDARGFDTYPVQSIGGEFVSAY